MVGMSRRFRDAGYDRPKYMLPLAGATCFDWSVMGFRDAFAEMTFVMRGDFDTPDFVRQRLAALGVTHARLVVLDAIYTANGITRQIPVPPLAAVVAVTPPPVPPAPPEPAPPLPPGPPQLDAPPALALDPTPVPPFAPA